jgi:hypothetical protein
VVRGEPDLLRDAGCCGGEIANELIERLSREANKARQAEITEEISEIVGGVNALPGAAGRRS